MTYWEKPLVDRLAVGASNVSKAWREGTVARLAGWEHQAMQEAESALRAAARPPEHPTPTQYAPELVASMEAFVRRCAGGFYLMGVNEDGVSAYEVVRDAKSIVSDLPQEVDPDEEAARQIAEQHGWAPAVIEASLSGLKAAIARGRQLQRGEAA